MKRKERFAKYRRERQIERASMQNKPQQRKSPINRTNQVQQVQKNEQPAERNDQPPNVIVVQVNIIRINQLQWL